MHQICYIHIYIQLAILPSLGTRYWRNRILKVATEFKNKVMTFAFASKKDFSRKLDTFGLSSDNDEVVVAIVSDDGMKYPMKEKFRYVYFCAVLSSAMFLNKVPCSPALLLSCSTLYSTLLCYVLCAMQCCQLCLFCAVLCPAVTSFSKETSVNNK